MWNLFRKKTSEFDQLQTKWLERQRNLQKNLWEKHSNHISGLIEKSKHLAVGSLAGAILLTSPVTQSSSSAQKVVKEKPFRDIDTQTNLLVTLHGLLPSSVESLSPSTEQKIAELLSNTFGLQVKPELQGIRLNTSYGYIGAEQHLARFPGDSMTTHFEKADDGLLYGKSGMAPGLGGWGYFASPSGIDQKAIDRERYYIAVQTFLAPGYMDHVKEYSTFFKFRKMLVVNPDNGKALIADIGDAGPAEWTGKQLGGSPEVMHYLERVDGAQKGPVLYFFIDDPQDSVPLGPITYNM